MKPALMHVHIRRLVVDAADVRALSTVPGALETAIEASLLRLGSDDEGVTPQVRAREPDLKAPSKHSKDASLHALSDAIAQRITEHTVTAEPRIEARSLRT